MILNDLQRIRLQILDEALRDTEFEYFMGERTKNNETGQTRSLIHHVNQRLKAINRSYKCSKRTLQNDVKLLEEKGAKLEPLYRRNHKRILRYVNLEWRNPLLKGAEPIATETAAPFPTDGPLTPVSLRISGDEQRVLNALQNPQLLQRQTDVMNGTVTIQVELPISDELFAVILGRGADVEVLAPDTLRDRVKQVVNAMQKLYKKENTAPKAAVQGDLFADMF